MKLNKTLGMVKYMTLSALLSFTLFSCQEEVEEIVEPSPTEILDQDSDLVALIQRTVNAESEEENNTIECVNFEYPISVSIFDTSFDVAETNEISSDTEFDAFLETLNDDVIAGINYPLNMQFADESTVESTSNTDLEGTLLDGAGTNCDEIIVNPITVGICDVDYIKENLIDCRWTISLYSVNQDYQGFTIYFEEDSTLTLFDNTDIAYTGDWEVFEEDEQLKLNISTQLINFSWPIVECGEDFIQPKGDDDTIILDKDCTTDEPTEPVTVQDCTQESTTASLIDCKWTISIYSVNQDYQDFTLIFGENASLSLFDNTDIAYDGDWEVFEEGDQLMLNISTQLIDFSWQIVECDGDRIQASGDSSTILLIKDCTVDVIEDDPEVTAAKELLYGCSWFMDRYRVDEENLITDYSGSIFQFSEDDTFRFYESEAAAYDGEWNIEMDENGVMTLILVPYQSLPDYINYNFVFDELREGFMLLSNNETQQQIITGFEQDCFVEP